MLGRIAACGRLKSCRKSIQRRLLLKRRVLRVAAGRNSRPISPVLLIDVGVSFRDGDEYE